MDQSDRSLLTDSSRVSKASHASTSCSLCCSSSGSSASFISCMNFTSNQPTGKQTKKVNLFLNKKNKNKKSPSLKGMRVTVGSFNELMAEAEMIHRGDVRC